MKEIHDDKPHTCEYCTWRQFGAYPNEDKYFCWWSLENNQYGKVRKLPKTSTCENFQKDIRQVVGHSGEFYRIALAKITPTAELE